MGLTCLPSIILDILLFIIHFAGGFVNLYTSVGPDIPSCPAAPTPGGFVLSSDPLKLVLV